jgi:hypothetical protein
MNQDMSQEIVGRYEHGFDTIDWQHYSHQDMWNMIMAADPRAMFDEATTANDLAAAMGDITIFLNRIAQNVVGAWSGPAAEAAAANIKRFLDWADGTANTVTGVAGLLSTYAHILNGARLSIPVPDGSDGSATHARQVMEHYAQQSQSVSDQLGQHRFSAPPDAKGLPLPAPEPAAQPAASAPHPTPHPTTVDALSILSTQPSSIGTTPSSVTAVPATSGGIGAGIPGLPGGAATGGMAGGSIPGLGSVSVVGAMAAGEMAPLMAAAEEQAGWTGFGSMPMTGRPAGGSDDEHRDRYSGRPDLIGELPPTFPPVLGA